MREPPPPQLTAMLERLGLATAAQVRRVRRRARRLAGETPRFESVWIDALAQARVITSFQAAELNAGRGESLRVGPYVLCERLPWPAYAACYRARRIASYEFVRLIVASDLGDRAPEALRRLEDLASISTQIASQQIAPIAAAGSDGDRLWAAAPWIDGSSAADWVVQNGRFPPEVVWEIARAMVAGLAELEKAGLCHGDLGAAGVLLTADGNVVLLQPGSRAVLRPGEGRAHAELPPEAYDYLAPEQVTRGAPPNAASDVFSCGLLWWHLLCGRPPLAGGNSLAKLRAAEAAAVPDLRHFAPEAPAPLAAAVAACIQREPARRPPSMAALAATLGPPTREGRSALVQCLVRPTRPTARWTASLRPRRRARIIRRRAVAVAACVLIAAAALWPFWRSPADPNPAAAETPSGDQSPPQRLAAAGEIGPGARDDAPARLGPSAEEGGHDSVDPAVRAAAYHSEPTAAKPPASTPPDLVLHAGEPTDGSKLTLLTGQRVHGPPGTRPRLIVPHHGLVIAADNVRFDDVDFVWSPTSGAASSTDAPAAMVELHAGRAEFHGCSFQPAQAAALRPAAICWMPVAAEPDAALSLPSGRVRLRNCVLHGVAAGVDCRRPGAIGIELSNTLHLGAGPLVRFGHCPKPDEPALLTISQVTLRGSGPLIEWACHQFDSQPGDVTVQAAGCVLVPDAGVPLLRFRGPGAPQRLLENVRWTGQGALVGPRTPIALWQRTDGQRQTLDDSAVSIAGLVRSEVGFAGEDLLSPAASRTVRWQAPLQTADPPGIDASQLPAMLSGNRPKP